MRQDDAGIGEVHARIEREPYRGERWSGGPSPRHSHDGRGDRGIGQRTGEALSRAREVTGELIGDARRAAERADLPGRTRRYPLVALGIAFGCGFLLAGRSRNRAVAIAKRQVRGLLLAGLVASLKSEGRGFLTEQVKGAFRRDASRPTRRPAAGGPNDLP